MTKSNTTDYEARAKELQSHGVPEIRARVVALREEDRTYEEIAAELEFGKDNDDRSQVKTHLDEYEKQLDGVDWLFEHGPRF